MSDLFPNLANQGAGSSKSNIQKYLNIEDEDYVQSLRDKKTAGTISKDDQYWLDRAERVRAARAKQKAGQELTDAEKFDVQSQDLFVKEGKEKGVEPTVKVSDSTGVPDLTDQRVRARRMAQTNALLAGRGRKQSFLGGNYDADELGGGSMLGGAP